ncbi:MAG: hypothetical protein K6G88_10945 [Lachnospiraceae bacterium]|nr:hypothetical protein [Lachnospiraceae bacterium]
MNSENTVMYSYKCMHRPPSPGAVPKDGLVDVKDFDMRDESGCYGEVVYNRALSNKEVCDYELEPLKEKPKNMMFINAKKSDVDNAVKRIICTKGFGENCDCDACKAYDNGVNPDVLIIDCKNDELGVSDFRDKLKHFYFKSINMSANKVLLIDGADELSDKKQNALLKFIEDYNDKAVLIAMAGEEKRVLKTVRSRVFVKRYSSILAYTDFCEYCKDKAIDKANIYYLLTDGDVNEIKSVNNVEIYSNLILAVAGKNVADYFNLLHISKEKDKEVIVNDRSSILMCYRLIRNVLLDCFLGKMNKEHILTVEGTVWKTKELANKIVELDLEIEKVRNTNSYKAKEFQSFSINLFS